MVGGTQILLQTSQLPFFVLICDVSVERKAISFYHTLMTLTGGLSLAKEWRQTENYLRVTESGILHMDLSEYTKYRKRYYSWKVKPSGNSSEWRMRQTACLFSSQRWGKEKLFSISEASRSVCIGKHACFLNSACIDVYREKSSIPFKLPQSKNNHITQFRHNDNPAYREWHGKCICEVRSPRV